MAELLRRVGDAAKVKPPGAWVGAPRTDHNELAEGRHPTAEELIVSLRTTPSTSSAPADMSASSTRSPCARRGSATTRRALMED